MIGLFDSQKPILSSITDFPLRSKAFRFTLIGVATIFVFGLYIAKDRKKPKILGRLSTVFKLDPKPLCILALKPNSIINAIVFFLSGEG